MNYARQASSSENSLQNHSEAKEQFEQAKPNLHKNARTTPAIRADIANSADAVSVLAARYNISEQTVYKWKKRDWFDDRSHRAHRLQTILSPGQERVVIALRLALKLSLDDLLAVTREFLNEGASRSGVDRCLRRHAIGKINSKALGHAAARKLSAEEMGSLNVGVIQLPQAAKCVDRQLLFFAVERVTRWLYVGLKPNCTANSVKAFLTALRKNCPLHVKTLRTREGMEFSNAVFLKDSSEVMSAEFEELRKYLDDESTLHGSTYRPAAPAENLPPVDNDAGALFRTGVYNRAETLEQNLLRFSDIYNQRLVQSALARRTPLHALKDGYASHPGMFRKRPYIRSGRSQEQR